MNEKKNYTAVIEEALQESRYIPFFLLSAFDQKKILQTLQSVFGALYGELQARGVLKTPLAQSVVGIIALLKESSPNEHAMIACIAEFFTMIDDGEMSRTSLVQLFKEIDARALAFATSEDSAARQRVALSREEIHAHDAAILQNNMQLYALDYFLYVYSMLKQKPQDSQRIILIGTDKLPALRTDALQDDMPKKIIFDFVDAKLRAQMIRDYYSYKKVFIPFAQATALTPDDIAKIVESLYVYCVSLIRVSVAHGVETLQYGIYTPYPVGTSLRSMEQDLTK